MIYGDDMEGDFTAAVLVDLRSRGPRGGSVGELVESLGVAAEVVRGAVEDLVTAGAIVRVAGRAAGRRLTPWVYRIRGAGDPDPGPLLFITPKDAAPLAGRAGVDESNKTIDDTRPTVKRATTRIIRETSREAAGRMQPPAKGLRGVVLAFIMAKGAWGATDDEGESELGIKPQTYTPRRGELVAMGLVVDSGVRRPTTSGCRAVVWFVAHHARDDAAGGAA